MKQLLIYLGEVMLISGILYGYYHFCLRNKRFHQYNRFYLLIACALSLLLPFINIPIYLAAEDSGTVMLETLQVVDGSFNEEPGLATANVSVATEEASYELVFYTLYILLAALLMIRFFIAMRNIYRLTLTSQVTQLEGVNFISTRAPGVPFSFFHWLFWDEQIDIRSEKGEKILRHELFHIRQRHSADIIYMEMLTIIFWINPFYHIIRKEITAIHEFLADRHATGANVDPGYAELLLMNALQTRQSLINPFFHNQIKRRIAMIIHPQKTRFQYFRKLLALPLGLLLFGLFAFSFRKSPPEIKSGKPSVKVVIDAGHGGVDAGAVSADGKHTESSITLQLAQRLAALAPEYGVEVILTRNDDKLPGGAASSNEGLKHSIGLVASSQPDIFLSLHMNTSDAAQKGGGIEAYISSRRTDSKSEQLSGYILQRLAKIYQTDMRIKRSTKGVYVLDKNTVPAVLLELGYMSNQADLAFILNKENQDRIAREILLAIVQAGVAPQQLQPTDRLLATDTVPAKSVSSKIAEAKVVSPSPDVLVVIDGKVMEGSYKTVIEKVDADAIKHVNILKHEKAVTKYGNIAANGVIEIYTKVESEIQAEQIIVTDAKIQKFESGEVRVVANQKTDAMLNEVVVVGYGKSQQDEPVFTKVEIEAAFKGGADAWRKFLQRNLNSNIPVINGAKEGTYTTIVQFQVNLDGTIANVKAITSHGHGMEDEAIRVIKHGPAWLPAIQNGKAVRSIRKQPVTYSVVREK